MKFGRDRSFLPFLHDLEVDDGWFSFSIEDSRRVKNNERCADVCPVALEVKHEWTTAAKASVEHDDNRSTNTQWEALGSFPTDLPESSGVWCR